MERAGESATPPSETKRASYLLAITREFGPLLAAILRSPLHRASVRAIDGSQGNAGLEVTSQLGAAWAAVLWPQVAEETRLEAYKWVLATHAELATCGWKSFGPALAGLAAWPNPALEEALSF